MTYLEVVSRIQNNLNSLDKDTFIPRRFILSVLKSKGEFLMAQKFNDKSLFRETNLFQWVRCIELEEIDIAKCGKVELQKCSSAMVSRKKIPKLIWSRYGPSILLVTNITDEKEYKLITPAEYINFRRRKNFNMFKGKYAILYPDGKIAIPDSTVKSINILLFTLDETVDSDGDCDNTENNCKSYWDAEFNLPTKIREVAIQESLKEIMLRLNIPKDEAPDGNTLVKQVPQG